MRVLVSGATGFVGTAVMRRLIMAGHEVIALVRTPRPFDGEMRTGDLLNPASMVDAVRGVDAVCHLAALTRLRQSFDRPIPYFQANTTGTLNLLAAMAEETERTGSALRLVFGSSGAVYGTPKRQPITEDETPRPESPYGASKYAAEMAIEYQAMTGKIGSVVLRAFNVGGAVDGRGDLDESHLIPKAIAVAEGRAEQLVINGDGTAVREFVHVDDLARAYSAALMACMPGRHFAYNVGSGVGSTVLEVVEMVEGAAGRSIPIRLSPAHREAPVLLSDSSRIRREIGWEPLRSDLHSIVTDAWSRR